MAQSAENYKQYTSAIRENVSSRCTTWSVPSFGVVVGVCENYSGIGSEKRL